MARLISVRFLWPEGLDTQDTTAKGQILSNLNKNFVSF
jgi:hypothetical protein